MRHQNAAGIRPHQQAIEPPQLHMWLAAMAAASVLSFLVLSSLLPGPLVLPVLALIAIASSAIVAVFVWARRVVRYSPAVTGWDVAGALAFIGFAAAMLSDPEQVIHLTETATTLSMNE